MAQFVDIVEVAARIAHEVNRVYCISIDDDSQPSWDLAPEWQKDSARAGVRAKIANPQSGPADSHAEWLAHKQADGWVWGPVKDPEKKEHPCMVPYDDLPAEQQIKDLFFMTVVASVLAALLPERTIH